jgi:hypothetical protein
MFLPNDGQTGSNPQCPQSHIFGKFGQRRDSGSRSFQPFELSSLSLRATSQH